MAVYGVTSCKVTLIPAFISFGLPWINIFIVSFVLNINTLPVKATFVIVPATKTGRSGSNTLSLIVTLIL